MSGQLGKGKFTDSTKKVPVTDVHSNLSQQIIEITADKLELVLQNYAHKMTNRNDWMAPGSVLLTLALAAPTTEFKDWWILSADCWQALFICIFVLNLGWLIKCLFNLGASVSVKRLIEEIKRPS